MNISRIARHLSTMQAQVARAFPPKALQAIEAAIRASESHHDGQVRFAVEGALDGMPLFKGQSARERAIQLFAHLHVWDTEHNNGLLIYLLLADRAVEIVADRGINAKVGNATWTGICRQMESEFKQSRYESGVITGIQSITMQLTQHFPASGRRSNELPDKPVVI